MDEGSTNGAGGQAVFGPILSALVREHVQRFIQGLLEDEVTELLRCAKYRRRRGVDAPAGYRNGYGKLRRLTLGCGTVELRRPRGREPEARFESRLVPLFVKRSAQVSELLPELYLHGLALGDFELALRGLLGDGAPLSPSTVTRLKQKGQAEYEARCGRCSRAHARPLDSLVRDSLDAAGTAA
jgi:putative transposase